MAGESKLSRLASNTSTVSDVRFAPVKASGAGGRVVTREEMDDFQRQVNERLQAIQTAYNELASRVKLQ